MTVRRSPLAACALAATLFLSHAALAAPGDGASIRILAPADHEQIESDEVYLLKYEVVPGAGGDHFHVWVDGQRGPGVHTLKGTYELPKLAPGEHTITIKIVDKGHVPTGPEQTIHLTSK